MCGCASIAEAEGAVEAGADAIGVILAPSPKRVSPADARTIVRSVPPFVAVVAVFVEPTAAQVDEARGWGCVPQFSGDESPAFCASAGDGRYVKALHVERSADRLPDDLAVLAAAFPAADILFDTRSGALYGGTGIAFAWKIVEPLARARRVIVSGGLVPENVADCVRAVRPFAVDVRSGVETNGVKDPLKMRAFVRAVRETDEQA
jgi:phosphoribosylanthranilate isomerase